MTRVGKKDWGYLLIGASALALAACGGGGGDQTTADTTPAADPAPIEDVTDAVVETAEAAEDTVEEAAGDVEAAAADMVDDATDAVDETVDDVVEETTDVVEDVVDDATDAVEDAVEDVTEAATDVVEDVTDAVEEAAAGASDLISANVIAEYEALTGDPRQGERVYAACRTCHVVQEGQNRVGPSLYGILGREAGSVRGFRYSPANQNSGITWTEPLMFAYLENPQAFIPGTIMAYAGMRSPQDRADVIAYIKQESGQ